MKVAENSDSPPLLHIEVSVQSKTVSELKAIVEIKLTYLNGTSGLNGAYELSQYIQNKWSQQRKHIQCQNTFIMCFITVIL